MIYVTPDVMPASVPAKEKKIMPLTMRNGVCLISYVHSIAVDIPVCDDNSIFATSFGFTKVLRLLDDDELPNNCL